ncbi:electron transfer flavoprotein subunit alpha [Ferrovum myxofaciens]|uniref:Electron transfer flavoprotein subunit alpha n=1 Tax=Ferrovum myxofaciens TaxID=416213 RepID=A0A149W1A5_9PROT|nr:FAD-binding protein [Ferrovum myxofaciens]KXW59262.1 electron transfer flavoprotein subunit alpha [Ferrovum myxofaciens]
MENRILLVTELGPDGHLKSSIRSLLAAAKALKGDTDVLIWGGDTTSALVEAQHLPGIHRVLNGSGATLAEGLAEMLCALVRPLARQYTHILTAATAIGKNWMPRLAALEDVAMISDVVGVESSDTFIRPIYAGSIWATVCCPESLKLITVRTTAFPGVEGERTEPVPVENLPCPAAMPLSTRISVHTHAQEGRPSLENARVVVSGGRGLGSAEHYEALLGPLAEELNAALGASRAAVDLGYAPNDVQVGQTGKVVAPDLYIAIGISGAIQHLAGMQTSRVIVAINKDPDAPIFAVADYGLVGDLNLLVPELTAALQK